MNEQATVTIGGKVDGDLMPQGAWEDFRELVDDLLTEEGFTLYVRNVGTGSWAEDGVTVTEPNYVAVGVHDKGDDWSLMDLAITETRLVHGLAGLAGRYRQSAIALGWRGKSHLIGPNGPLAPLGA